MSELKFQCETCGQHILVDAREAGRKLVCPSCRTQLTIPKPQAAPPKKPRAREPRAVAGPAVEPSAAGGQGASAPQGMTAVQPSLVASEQNGCEPHPSMGAGPPQQRTSVEASTPAMVAPTPRVAALTPAMVALTPTAMDATPRVQPAPAPAAKSQAPAESAPDRATERERTTEAATAASAPAHVAVLTTEVKREIVGAARKRIGDRAHWVAGVGEDGKLTYAAKQREGRLERVEVDDPGATQYSLLGAVLLELHRHNVTATATGRTAFLDQDIPATIREVTSGPAQAAADGEAPDPTDPRLMSISHPQCLAVLDRLDRDYATESGSSADSAAPRELRGASLDELMVRAARDEAVSTTELLRALHRELTDYNRRLAALEKARGAHGTRHAQTANPEGTGKAQDSSRVAGTEGLKAEG